MGISMNVGPVVQRLRVAGPRESVLANAVLRSSALAVEADAKARAPVDTGALRASIHTTFDMGAARSVAEVSPGVHYDIYQELGTSIMAPQPYLFPALRAHTAQFYAGMAAAIGGAFGG